MLGTVGLAGLFAGMIGMGGPAAADGGCANLTKYSALGGASGVSANVSVPGLTLVEGGDVHGPAAQGLYDSVEGATGWAGAPYSNAVSDNLGVVAVPEDLAAAIPEALQKAIPFFYGMNGNDIPLFAVSRNGSPPRASKNGPGLTLEASSGDSGSAGKAVAGALSSPDNTIAASVASGAVTCDDNTTLKAVGDNVASGIDIGGVLRIASVASHAEATVDHAGQRHIDGTMVINGATVAGQPVSITDKGVVLAGGTSPLAKDPVTPALQAAGISVKYVELTKDDADGQVLAPGLQITVTKAIAGVGSGPVTTTFSIGRAIARSGLEPGADDSLLSSTDDFSSSFSDTSSYTDAGAADVAPAGADATGGSAAAAPAATGRQATVPTAQIADWSIASGYSAMGVGALFLLVAWLGLERIAVRFRWR